MTKSIMLALATAGALFCSANANAGGHVSWSVGINAPAVGAVITNGPAYGYGYPVYESYPVYAPAPVYYQPAPVYYQPAPVYYRSAPVVYGPPAYYHHHRHHRHAYRPVAPYPRHWR
jgi:hypothetical protein